MKHMTRLLLVAGMIGLGAKAGAVNNSNPVDVEVWANINANLVIAVTSATTYDYGTVSGSSVTVSATTFDIQNTGAGLTETYQIKANNSANWTVGALPAADVFSLDAQFNFAAAPAVWTGLHRLTAAYQSSNALIFAGNETGLSTATNAVRHLWTRLSAPTSTSSSARQRVKLDINAITP